MLQKHACESTLCYIPNALCDTQAADLFMSVCICTGKRYEILTEKPHCLYTETVQRLCKHLELSSSAITEFSCNLILSPR